MAATFAPGAPGIGKQARGLCGLLLADLLEGPARLAATERIRADAGIEPYRELALLDLEADPRRADARHVFLGIIHPAWTLAGKSAFSAFPSPLALRAFRRLAAEADPPPAVRRERLNLASGAVSFAAISGLEAESLAWVDLVARDLEALRASGERIDADDLEAASIHRAYVELRAGRPKAPPGPPDPSEKAGPSIQESRRELEGVIAYVETGSLEGLKEPFEFGTFGRRRGARDDVFTGLEIAARGSGEEFAAWLAERVDPAALPAALVGATRIRTGKEAVLAWLRKGPEYDLGGSRFAFGERAAAAATRARIAEILGDAALAADFRALAKRLREGLFRRDTGLALHLVGVR